jgi:hypothetical protein
MALLVFNATLLIIFLISQQKHVPHALNNANSIKPPTNAILCLPTLLILNNIIVFLSKLVLCLPTTQKIYLVLRINPSIMALLVFNATLLIIFLISQQKHVPHALNNTNSIKPPTNAIS